MRKTTKSTVRC